ncbi:MAG: hypothetical protein M3619_25585 [Myxococcota bacterium]|nr:hypothetical protein [Myxococcota bacterium]
MTDLSLEAVALGDPFAAAHAVDTAAIATRRSIAEAKLFPADLVPINADTIALYGHHLGRFPLVGFGDAAALVHGRAVVTHPDLAACFRSAYFLEEIDGATAQFAPRLALDAAGTTRAIAEARARYQRSIAAQIVAVREHDLAASAREWLACEVLETRLAAAKARHEEHAGAELARAEADRRAAARVVAERTAERVRAAALQAEQARAQLAHAEREHSALRGEALAARVRASGLDALRVGSRWFDAAEIAGHASSNQFSDAQLAVYEDAIAEAAK